MSKQITITPSDTYCIICNERFYSHGNTCDKCANIMDGGNRNERSDKYPNIPTTKKITISIEDTMCISKEWLDEREQITEEYLNSDLILSHEVDGVNNLLHFIRIIKSQLFPSKVLVEGAFNKCFVSGKITIANRGIERNNFLTTPITLNIEENGK